MTGIIFFMIIASNLTESIDIPVYFDKNCEILRYTIKNRNGIYVKYSPCYTNKIQFIRRIGFYYYHPDYILNNCIIKRDDR